MREYLHYKTQQKKFGMETPPEKSETMAFLRQDPVICKILEHNKCLQQAKNLKYLGCEIPHVNESEIQQKLATVLQILGILKKKKLKQLWSSNVQEQGYIMHWLLHSVIRKRNLNPPKRITKQLTSIKTNFFQKKSRVHSFRPQKE
jgi:hypothetical protein